jgi:radical SAM superfamily enzyme YgiQ (UPF0313 family)
VFDTMMCDPETGFAEALAQHHPRIVAIYEDDFNFLTKMCLTRMREVAWGLTEKAKACGAKVIAHGSDATDHSGDYLKRGVDYILLGEAERELLDLCSALLEGKSESAIEGVLSWSSGPMIIPVARQQWVALPSPARDLIDLAPYRKGWREAHGYFSLNLVASRGCPYRCNWSAKPISGDRFHVRPASQVAQELIDLKTAYGADHAWFGDDVFALNRHWAQEFADEIHARCETVPFKIQSRADLMTAETVDALRRAGCAEVWMGIESGSQRILDAMDKGLMVEQVIAARERLRNVGIRACYFLQLGYAGETWSDILQTVALVRHTRPDDIGVSVSYPLPNTRFYEKVQAQLGPKRNWSDSDDLCVIFKGAYTDNFYRVVRDALHAEVDSWARPQGKGEGVRVPELWERVLEMEPVSRNQSPTRIDEDAGLPASVPQSHFVPVGRLQRA